MAYCDKRVCLCVCLSVCLSVFSPAWLIVTCDRGSVFHWQRWEVCTSGFVDDVMFANNATKNNVQLKEIKYPGSLKLKILRYGYAMIRAI